MAQTLPSSDFALRLLANLHPGQSNLVLSPYSARLVLALLWTGSEGETREEMTRALGLDGSPDEPSNHYERLGKPLGFQLETERRNLQMHTANALWCDQGFVLKPEFAKAANEDYCAEIQAVDFAVESSAGKINDWVNKKTQGCIAGIIDPESLRSSWPLLALNAVYFKGLWKDPFEEESTKNEEFTLHDGTKQHVPLMRQSGEFGYTERAGTQIVQLPYEGQMSMFVILPPKETPIDKFCSEMRTTIGTSWSSGLGERRGHLRLPRFRMDTCADLTTALRALGIAHAFDPEQAALDRISNLKPLFLKSVLQWSYVDVNEKGTEAAAFTGLEVCGSEQNPEPPPPPFRMIVNRPFVFAICDDWTGTIVFLGVVVDPAF
jgi:serpin B